MKTGPLRIALVCPYDWNVQGGVRTHIRELARHFRSWGHDVTIFAPASDPEAAKDECVPIGRPVKVRASGSVARITFTWRNRQVRDALDEGNFDIVHLHEPLMPLLPYYFLRNSQTVNIGTFHAAREGGNRIYGYTRPLTRRWFRKLDGKIAVSTAAVSLVSRYFAGYFNIIPNGIDYEYWSQPREPLAEFQDGKLNLLFVGRPEKRKGLRYLLRAYIQLRQSRDDVRLIVVGAGDFHRYERLMKDYPDVIFRANVPHDELPRYHYTADICCCPNTGGESQGYVLMEALAAGRPVVASNIEGFATVVADELEGVLVPARDPTALARAIGALLDDPERRGQLAANGQRRAEQYSWDRIARRVLSYYQRILMEHHHVAQARDEPEAEAAL